MRFMLIAVGVALLTVFLVSGHSLFRFNPALADAPALRFTLRGHHIYILLMGLFILVLGAYFQPHELPRVRYLQIFAATLLVASALLVAATFFAQDAAVDHRPVTNRALKVFAFASLLLAAAAPRRRFA